jgi:hypothetical protein
MELTLEELSKKTGLSIEQLQVEERRRRTLVQAGMTPFPGPAKDAFALSPEIEVGKFKVRPFYDIDFELLAEIKHPLYDACIKLDKEASIASRGPQAWQLCWLFTHTPEEGEAAVKDGTLDSEAKAEFSKMQLKGLTALQEVIYHQLELYWAPMMSYEEGDGDSKKNSSLDLEATTSVPTALAG